jgi:hypothetical protein
MYERTTVIDIWTYPEPAWASIDLTGFKVDAIDGEIGTVDEATRETGGGYLVVHSGAWIFGKKIVLPAGLISQVSTEDRRVFVSLTKDEIDRAPAFDESTYRDPEYRNELTSYYGANRPPGPDYGKDDRTR